MEGAPLSHLSCAGRFQSGSPRALTERSDRGANSWRLPRSSSHCKDQASEMSYRTLLSVWSLFLGGSVVACTESPITDPLTDPVPTYHFDFTKGSHGWHSGFADHPPAWAEKMELVAGHEPLPAGLGVTGRGLYIAGTNHSDDLFMFWAGRVEGLAPSSSYRVGFTVEFASEAPTGCAGIGGPPAEAVVLKAGASAVRPEPVLGSMGSLEYMVMNIDKGVQSSSGEHAFLLGHIGNTKSSCNFLVWEIMRLESEAPLEVVTDDQGAAWIIVGTDSGFEGRSQLYYTSVEAFFEPI